MGRRVPSEKVERHVQIRGSLHECRAEQGLLQASHVSQPVQTARRKPARRKPARSKPARRTRWPERRTRWFWQPEQRTWWQLPCQRYLRRKLAPSYRVYDSGRLYVDHHVFFFSG